MTEANGIPEEPFDPAELAAADTLDARIDDLLAGRARPDTPPEVLFLHAAVRTDPPATLAERVAERHEQIERRRWRPVRYAAAALAYLFLSQGFGSLVWGDWVAEGVGDDFSEHAAREGGFALIAVGLAVLAGALRRRLVPVSVVSGVPLAIALGFLGVGEIGVFAPGAVLHLTEGVVGILFAVTAWRYWRDTSGPPDEEGA